eukprot:TRINITY_DN80744_c0_g1_i1.p1 TRINITY_DN80744_c0_g1~~TRINITY_DN80744_c0_g1_i1.p1  ORF type:complete len:882 (-),score=316.91 TRINITY_DN80744_c0_g1_i1:357-3002(-)
MARSDDEQQQEADENHVKDGELQSLGVQQGAGEVVMSSDAVDVVAGQVRLQGQFQGTATTHTHQLDLSMGLDVEMPSDMAAEAMRQIASRSVSPSPALLNGPSDPGPRAHLEAPQRGLWNSLQDFFRRDAQDARMRGRSPDLRLKLEDASQQTRKLSAQLCDAEGHASMFEGRIAELEEERDSLAAVLEETRVERDEQALELEALRTQRDLTVTSSEAMGQTVLAKDTEIQALEGKVEEAEREIAEHRNALAAEVARRERFEKEAAAAHVEAQSLREEAITSCMRIEELEQHSAGLQAKLDVLQQQISEPPAGSDEYAETLEKLETVRRWLDEAETAKYEAQKEDRMKIEDLEAQVRHLKDMCSTVTAEREGKSEETKRHSQIADTLRTQLLEHKELYATSSAAEQRMAAEIESLNARLEAMEAAAALGPPAASQEEKEPPVETSKSCTEADNAAAVEELRSLEKKAARLEDKMRASEEDRLALQQKTGSLQQRVDALQAGKVLLEEELATLSPLRQEVESLKTESCMANAAQQAMAIRAEEAEQALLSAQKDHQKSLETLRATRTPREASNEELKQALDKNAALQARMAELTQKQVEASTENATLKAQIAYHETVSVTSKEKTRETAEASSRAQARVVELERELSAFQADQQEQHADWSQRHQTAVDDKAATVKKAQDLAAERDNLKKEVRALQQKTENLETKYKEEATKAQRLGGRNDELARLRARVAQLEKEKERPPRQFVNAMPRMFVQPPAVVMSPAQGGTITGSTITGYSARVPASMDGIPVSPSVGLPPSRFSWDAASVASGSMTPGIVKSMSMPTSSPLVQTSMSVPASPIMASPVAWHGGAVAAPRVVHTTVHGPVRTSLTVQITGARRIVR